MFFLPCLLQENQQGEGRSYSSGINARRGPSRRFTLNAQQQSRTHASDLRN